MRRIELAPRVGPDAAIALWHEVESGLEGTDLAAGALLLDGQHVQYLSAAGFQVLVVAAARLAQDGASLRIVDPSTALRKTLSYLGGDYLLNPAVGGAA